MGLETELAFRLWAADRGTPSPDDPRHHYDYRRAWLEGVEPTPWRAMPWLNRMEDVSQAFMGEREPFSPDTFFWPDKFKGRGHPVPPR